MDYTSQIGIAVSGCKNGYAILAADGIDSTSQLLRTSLRDLRSYLRVTEPGHNYFTMSVYGGTLIISACRSSVDAVGSSGGFIAVSLIVPASLRVHRPAELLTELLNEYWTEFMHPMFGSPLPGKFESAHRLRALLQAHSADITPAVLRYRIYNSEGSQPPLFMGFNSIAEVDEVMTNPWHRAYTRGCELIMVPHGLLSSPKVNYNIEVRQVTMQHGAPGTALDVLLMPRESPVRLTSYAVNSVPYDSVGRVSLKPADLLSFTLSLPDGTTMNFTGTLREALERKVIKREGDNYRLNTPLLQVSLKITGQRPSQGCVYALTPLRGTPIEGKADPSNPLLRVFTIPCAGFPYSLVEAKAGRAQRPLCPDAVTADNLAHQPISVVAKTQEKPLRPFGRSPFSPRKIGRRLPLPIIVAVSALAIGLIGLFIWLWAFPSEPEQPSKHTDDKTITPKDADKDWGEDDEKEHAGTPKPKYTYLFIPVEVIREAKTGNTYDHLSSAIFPEGTDYIYDKATKLTIIRIPKMKRTTLNLDEYIYLEGAQQENSGFITLDKVSVPDHYDDLKNYLTSDVDRIVVTPMDMAKQPSPELMQQIKTMPLDDLEFQPFDNTPPTGAGGGTLYTEDTGGDTGGKKHGKPKPGPQPPKPTPDPPIITPTDLNKL